MVLGNQVEWALHCCSVLAGLPEGGRASTKTLAEFHGVPKEYLSKGLQQLAQAGIITGTLGPAGGYRLARAPGDITFLDIVEAVEGRQKSFNCTEIRRNNPCLKGGLKSKVTGVCLVARTMYRADEAWRAELQKTTLQDLLGGLMREVDSEILRKSGEWLAQR